MCHKAEKSPSHLNHLDSCSRFIFISLCFSVLMVMYDGEFKTKENKNLDQG